MANLDEIRQYIREELTPAHGQRGKYICPICGSGTGAKGTAAFSIDRDGIHGKCFSCNFYGDLFDLIAKRDGISIQEATRAALDRYGSPAFKPSTPAQPQRKPEAVEAPARDFRAEIQRYHSAIKGSAGEKYLNGRGITSESIDRFSLGFDEQRQQIIIPYNRSGSYYGMRNISANALRPHDKPAGVKAPLFNAAALYGSEPCFVVESPLCAISIMQEGGTALALGGLNTTLLQAEIEKKRPTVPLLLSLDNDTPKQDGSRPGQDAAAELAAWLDEKGIAWTLANVAGNYKDPNEALQQEPEPFRQRIRDIVADYQMLHPSTVNPLEAAKVSKKLKFNKKKKDISKKETESDNVPRIMNDNEKAVYNALCSIPKSPEEISEQTGLTITEAVAYLSTLTMREEAKELPGDLFIRTKLKG